MSWALSISLTHWRASRITAHISSFQCCGLSLQGILGILFWEHLKCMTLLFVLCRHVTVRVRGRIIFGEVRNHITAAKEKAQLHKKPSAQIHWQQKLEISRRCSLLCLVFLATLFGPCWLWPCHDPFYFLPTLPWPPWDDSLSEYIYVSCIKILLSWPQQISRGVCSFTCDFRGWFSFYLAPYPKEIIFLSYFSQSLLLLGSFKTCLLIASWDIKAGSAPSTSSQS